MTDDPLEYNLDLAVDKLRQVSPRFVAGYEAWAAVNGRSSAADASR